MCSKRRVIFHILPTNSDVHFRTVCVCTDEEIIRFNPRTRTVRYTIIKGFSIIVRKGNRYIHTHDFFTWNETPPPHRYIFPKTAGGEVRCRNNIIYGFDRFVYYINMCVCNFIFLKQTHVIGLFQSASTKSMIIRR